MSHQNDPENTGKKGGGLVAWFADNHPAANIFMLFFILAGLGSLTGTVKEIFPAIDPRIIVVTVPYPGATPQDVESGVTRRVEEAVIGIEGVDRVESVASEGIGTITIELEDFINGNEVLNDIETEIDALQDFPPENAEEVTIVKVKSRSDVMTLVLYGEAESTTLLDWAETVEDELLRLDNVSLVEISGLPNREISIEVEEKTLRQYGLAMGDVADAVRAFSVDIPAGNLETASNNFLVRVQERRYYGGEFENIVVQSRIDGAFIRLGDIATIKDGLEDKEVINTYNDIPAVFVDVQRSDGQDTLAIEKEIKSMLKTLALPQEITLEIWNDDTEILKDRINLLLRNAIMGFILVFIALLLFLDLKLAFWTAVAIPVSFLGGMFVASLLGVSINMISLFALIVVLGIVVDDAIVTGESIFEEQERRIKAGQPLGRASMRGVHAVIAPVTIGVLTTIAAFAPLIFSTGTLGQILQPIPIIVISVLLISLFEAFFILPAHLAHANRWSMGYLRKARRTISDKLFRFIDYSVIPLLKFFITTRYLFFPLVLFIIWIAFFMLSSGQLKFIFFPQIESDEISVTLEMPVGTPFAVTQRHANAIVQTFKTLTEDEIRGTDGPVYKNISKSIGLTFGDRGGPGSTASSTFEAHLAQIQVELVPSTQRKINASEIAEIWRASIPDIPQVKKVAFESALVSGGSDINIELSHRDSDILEKTSEELKLAIKQMDYVSEVVDTLEPGKKEFVFKLTDAGLAAGLTPANLGLQLRNLFEGQEVDRIQRGPAEIEVAVRYTEAERNSFQTLDNIRLRLPSGANAPIGVMTNIQEQFSPTQIKRVDGRQVVTITADVNKQITTPDEVISKIKDGPYAELKNRFPGLSFALAGQNKDQQDDLATLGQNMLVALLVIFVMLTSLLRSYVQPLVIMMTIPLGVAGAIYGHILLGRELTFISFFGIVALMGVIINDSVVFVDYFNQRRRENPDMDIIDHVCETLRRRFRPIMLTTLTTSLGLLPMLLETSLQAQFIIPMAVSLATGIVFGGSLLIFFIPVILVIIEDINGLRKRIMNMGKAQENA